jgi:hypothetical protein
MVDRDHRGAFAVDDPSGPRFDLALERLRSGASFEFEDVAFQISEDGALVCVVDSSWEIGNVTESTAASDFAAGQVALEHLLKSSPPFAAAVFGRPVRYELIDHYGTGSVLICSKVGENMTWAGGMRPGAG